jgi:hypothetical protein
MNEVIFFMMEIMYIILYNQYQQQSFPIHHKRFSNSHLLPGYFY